MEGVFRFKSWFLNTPGPIHGGAYYSNFMVYDHARSFGIIMLHQNISVQYLQLSL